jgi:hypothetical protein
MKAALLSWSGVVVAASVAAGGAVLAPEALRRVDEFHVTRVVVHGAVLLEPAEALVASGITTASSIFDDEEQWIAALRSHPLVREARVERELPATLHVHVEETTPLAFAQTPELRVVDALGHILPIRIEGHDLDLPVLAIRSQLATLEAAAALIHGRSFLRITDEPSLRALELLAALETLDAELAALVSEATPLPARDVLLTLRAPEGMQLVMRAPATAEQLRAVRLTLAHLRAADDDAALRVRIDARFRDQIIVAPLAKASRSTTGGTR